MDPHKSEHQPKVSKTKAGFVNAPWVAPIVAPPGRPTRDRLLAHSDTLSHTDGGSHVDAHGDHGDK